MKNTLLIVDDEADLLKGLKRSLCRELDCDVLTAEDGNKALGILGSAPVDLMLTDISMPGMDGMELLKSGLKYDPLLSVIMMTAYGTIEIAVEALKIGAYDFVQKPFDFDHLVRLLRKGLERNRLLRENTRLQQRICERTSLENLVGKSVPMMKVHSQIKTLARTDVTVLITGETGTGKDLAANAIHENSKRRSKPMITVNCPALPEGLLESELFGHVKGAFTGADTVKKGLFDLAEGSSILLDEVGDLPPSLQTKLLRVLQNQEVTPVGSGKSHQVDVRILAATNQDLTAKIESGEFRADLFYRLNVASLVMPTLSDLKNDIPLLVNHFLTKSACELKIDPKQVSKEVLNHLGNRSWPGNMRELENVIRAWTATVPDAVILPENILGNIQEMSSPHIEKDLNGLYKDLKDRVIEQFTREYVCHLLQKNSGNVTLSAKISGIKRQSLQKIITRYAIDVDGFR
jgi:DNA-binding NtrC family response regulator